MTFVLLRVLQIDSSFQVKVEFSQMDLVKVLYKQFQKQLKQELQRTNAHQSHFIRLCFQHEN